MNITTYIQNYKDRLEDLPSLMLTLSDLMQEGYQLSESFTMLLPYYTKNPEKWQEIINDSLQNGLDATTIFKRLKVDNEFLISLQLAERHGDLAKTLKVIGAQMQYKDDMKKRLRKILAYPVFMFFVLIIFFIGFRVYFLPNISSLITSRSTEDTSSIQWSKFLLHMPDYYIVLLAIFSIVLYFVVRHLKKKKIEFQLNFIFRLPLIGYFYRLLLTRQFARNLGNLVVTGFTLQQALVELKTQTFQKNIQYVAAVIEGEILEGDSITEAIRKVPYFYNKFDLFVEHGERSGLLGRELLLYCDILDEKLKSKITQVFAFIQPLFFVIIATCIVAAYLSILLPMYKMIEIV